MSHLTLKTVRPSVRSVSVSVDKPLNTRCAWAGGTCVNYPDFFENHQFHVIYCVTLAYVLFSKNF